MYDYDTGFKHGQEAAWSGQPRPEFDTSGAPDWADEYSAGFVAGWEAEQEATDGASRK